MSSSAGKVHGLSVAKLLRERPRPAFHREIVRAKADEGSLHGGSRQRGGLHLSGDGRVVHGRGRVVDCLELSDSIRQGLGGGSDAVGVHALPSGQKRVLRRLHLLREHVHRGLATLQHLRRLLHVSAESIALHLLEVGSLRAKLLLLRVVHLLHELSALLEPAELLLASDRPGEHALRVLHGHRRGHEAPRESDRAVRQVLGRRELQPGADGRVGPADGQINLRVVLAFGDRHALAKTVQALAKDGQARDAGLGLGLLPLGLFDLGVDVVAARADLVVALV
mmetsp:Transcript_606/g.2231  ORF Transcript_606/g.2231 Transcript_606/m.2231 type:complete len:281 (+) Transcript_606:727-1569(+)